MTVSMFSKMALKLMPVILSRQGCSLDVYATWAGAAPPSQIHYLSNGQGHDLYMRALGKPVTMNASLGVPDWVMHLLLKSKHV